MELPVGDIESCVTLAKQCKLDKLIALMEDRCKKLASFGKSKDHIAVHLL